MLRGFRGAPPADVDALALSWLAADPGDQLAALEINPLIVMPAGQEVVAVGALLERARSTPIRAFASQLLGSHE